jgi:hypothetical protein
MSRVKELEAFCMHVYGTVFGLKAGGQLFTLDVGLAQVDGLILSNLFLSKQFEKVPKDIIDGILKLMDQLVGSPLCYHAFDNDDWASLRSSGLSRWTLVKRCALDADLKLLRATHQTQPGDDKVILGLTKTMTLVYDLVWCNHLWCLRSSPYHRPRRESDMALSLTGEVLITGAGDTDIMIKCQCLDLDQDTHIDVLWRRFDRLPDRWIIAFMQVLGESALDVIKPDDVIKPALSYLNIDHLKDSESDTPSRGSRYRFELLPKESLPGVEYDDNVEFKRMICTPFMVGDHNASKHNKKGFLDPASDFELADLVWISPEVCLRGPSYVWRDQYLYELDTNHKETPRLKAMLHAYFQENWDQAVLDWPLLLAGAYKQSGGRHSFHLTGSKPLNSITGIPLGDEESESDGDAPVPDCVVLDSGLLVRPGMGILISHTDLQPLSDGTPRMTHGYVLRFEPHSVIPRRLVIIYRAMLGREDIPSLVLSRMTENELLQTNLVCSVNVSDVIGCYSILPSAMFHSGCDIPSESLSKRPKKQGLMRDKIVIAHAEILDLESKEGTASPKLYDWRMLYEIQVGQRKLEIWRVSPIASEQSLSILCEGNRLFGPLRPHPACYCDELEAMMHRFAMSKTSAKLRVTENTFPVTFAGRILMELVYSLVESHSYTVALVDGTMSVTIPNLDNVVVLFGRSINQYDFTNEGKGTVKINGPIVFKWSMYDDFQRDGRAGRTEGYAAVTVGSYEELNRMGQLIKSSKGNPGSKAQIKRRPRKSQ